MVTKSAVYASFIAAALLIVLFSENLVVRIWSSPLWEAGGSAVYTGLVAAYGVALCFTLYRFGETLRRKNIAQIAGFAMVTISVAHEFRCKFLGPPADRIRFFSTLAISFIVPLIWYGWAIRRYRARKVP